MGKKLRAISITYTPSIEILCLEYDMILTKGERKIVKVPSKLEYSGENKSSLRLIVKFRAISRKTWLIYCSNEGEKMGID